MEAGKERGSLDIQNRHIFVSNIFSSNSQYKILNTKLTLFENPWCHLTIKYINAAPQFGTHLCHFTPQRSDIKE